MKHIFNSIIIFLITGSAYAGSFSVGGTVVDIPSPEGFHQVTSNMDVVYRLSQQMTDPVNDQLAYYISEKDVPNAMSGGTPLLERYFILKVNKDIKNMIVDTNDFSDLKKVTKKQNNEIFKSVEEKMAAIIDETSKNISKEFDVNMAIKMTQMIPLSPHHETSNSFSYSAYINFGVTAQGSNEEFIASGTVTFINLAGKVLFLYCYGPQNDMEWTQTASRSWEESILSLNSLSPRGSSGGME